MAKTESVIAEIAPSQEIAIADDRERATEDELAFLTWEIGHKVAEHGKRWAFSSIPQQDSSIREKGYSVHNIPEELVPEDARSVLKKGEEIHATINIRSEGEPEIAFIQNFATADRKGRQSISVTYNPSGEGTRVIEQRTTSYDKPFSRRTQPDQRSFISGSAVSQLINILDNPVMMPDNKRRDQSATYSGPRARPGNAKNKV